MTSLQRAALTGQNISMIPVSQLTYNTTFTATSRDKLLNGLWFVSLVLTLSTAIIAGFIKQWINYYLVDVPGTPRDRACTRQLRYMGLTRWNVSPIIELLPVLMTISLLLFFTGLILFTQDLDGLAGIQWFLVVVTLFALLFYVGSGALPIWIPDCPYKTSLTQMLSLLLRVIESSRQYLGYVLRFSSACRFV